MATAKFTTKDVTTPKPGLMVYGPSYWMCEGGDPKKALFYGTSPQCNKNRSMVEHIMNNGLYTGISNLQIVYIETSFVPDRD
jgi:hypothetical protein